MRLKVISPNNEKCLIKFEDNNLTYVKEYLREYFDLKYNIHLEVDGFKVTQGALYDNDVVRIIKSDLKRARSPSVSSSESSDSESSDSNGSDSNSSDTSEVIEHTNAELEDVPMPLEMKEDVADDNEIDKSIQHQQKYANDYHQYQQHQQQYDQYQQQLYDYYQHLSDYYQKQQAHDEGQSYNESMVTVPPGKGSNKTKKRNRRNKKKLEYRKLEQQQQQQNNLVKEQVQSVPPSKLPENGIPPNIKVTSVDVEKSNWIPGERKTIRKWTTTNERTRNGENQSYIDLTMNDEDIEEYDELNDELNDDEYNNENDGTNTINTYLDRAYKDFDSLETVANIPVKNVILARKVGIV